MNDGVKAFQITDGQVAYVAPDIASRRRGGTKIAGAIEVAVAPRNLMPRRPQHRGKKRAYIAALASNEDPHPGPPSLSHVAHGASPRAQISSSSRFSWIVSMHCQNPSCRKAIS